MKHRWYRSVFILIVVSLLVAVGCGEPAGENQDNGVNQNTNNYDIDELCDQMTPLSGDIDSDTTITPDCYEVSGVIDISATLTIEAGTVLRFDTDAGLRVRAEGTLIAEGTTDDKIVLTSLSEIAGSWYGIVILSNSPDNSLAHVIVEDTGAESHSFNRNNGSSVILRDSGRVSLTDNIFRDGTGDGVIAYSSDTRFDAFENNHFANNEGAPLWVTTVQLAQLGSGNTYDTAGGDDFIAVSATTVSDDGTWSDQGIAYRFHNVHTISEATVVIEAGTVLEFRNESGLMVADEGVLQALGEDGGEVLFTSALRSPESWYGLAFTTIAPGNTLDHVIVEYAGQGSHSFNRNGNANLTLRNDAQITITNSIFRNSSDYGINLMNSSFFAELSDSHFEGNDQASIKLSTAKLGGIGDGNSFEDEFVEVDAATVTDDATWKAIDVHYRVDGAAYIEDGTVTIEPGAEFRFRSGSGISTTGEGVLIAEGTTDDRILFTSNVGVSGSWQGIVFNSLRSENSLDYVTIEYAGEESHSFNRNFPGNLVVRSSGLVAVTNSEFDESSGYGAVIRSSATVTDEDGTELTSQADLEGAGNSFYGNGTDPVLFE